MELNTLLCTLMIRVIQDDEVQIHKRKERSRSKTASLGTNPCMWQSKSLVPPSNVGSLNTVTVYHIMDHL